jgi:hypothetical protein
LIARFAPFAALCAVATARAAFSPAIPSRGLGDEAVQRAAFDELRSQEPARRRAAATDFPTDPWSQSDAFHDAEAKAAQAFANHHKVSLTAVLAGLDDGMRAARARGDRKTTGSVPPCHPRAIY